MVEKSEFVYLRTGEKCRVLGKDGDRIFASVQIVHEYLYGDEEQTVEEDGQILELPFDSLYEFPPIRVLSEEVRKLEERVVALRSEALCMGDALRKAKQESEEKLAEYARRSDALAKLDLFLLGGITHYFMEPRYGYSQPRILTVEETLSEKYPDKGKGRLLSLRPEKGHGSKSLIWALSNTGTGSGSDWECVPCTSREEALALGQKWIVEQAVAEAYSVTVVDFAREYGLVLPGKYIPALIKEEERFLERREQEGDTKREEKRAEKKAHWKMLRGAEAEDREEVANEC